MTLTVEQVMASAPVIPVMVIENIEHAVPLAQALVEGGLKVLEITLRTPVALDAIRAIRAQLPDAIVGAGTVINEETLSLSVEAGAEFIVSPGFTPELIDAAFEKKVPILPGVNSPSEVMTLLNKGITAMKFFPAQAAGGAAMLKAIGGPLPQVTFCPTGGVNRDNAREYLQLNNVACVGGSWMAPAALVAEQRWDEIRAAASEAAALTG